MLNHQPPPNWVRGRADCNLDMTFEALHEIVKRDVEEFNGLPKSKRRGRTFRVCDNTEGCVPKFMVAPECEGPARVIFSLEETAIRINGGGVHFYVRPRWDGTRCRMHVNDDKRPSEIWELGQAALEVLFFAHDDGRV